MNFIVFDFQQPYTKAWEESGNLEICPGGWDICHLRLLYTGDCLFFSLLVEHRNGQIMNILLYTVR